MALDTSFFEQHQDAAQNQAAIDARYFNQAAAAASQHAASNEVLIWEWIVCIALIVSILIILEIWLKIPILKKIKMIIKKIGTGIFTPKAIITIGGILIVLRLIFPVMQEKYGDHLFYNFVPIEQCTTDCSVDIPRTEFQVFALILATAIGVFLVTGKKKEEKADIQKEKSGSNNN
jgi:energy-converting hydrogenase Eha subunit A